MKISHPRFLDIGNQDEWNIEFPACLEKKINVEKSGVLAKTNKMSQDVFLFPEVSLGVFHIQGSFEI